MVLRRRQQNETSSPRTDLWFRGGSSSVGSSSPQHWSEGCSAEAAHADGAAKTNWLNATVASALPLYGKKASSLLCFFFSHCLFVSLLCFLCPLLRQRCRWIGAVSVRDLRVISWNVHPSKHKKLGFKLFELYSFLAVFHWHSVSIPRSKPFFMVEIYFIWVFRVCVDRKTVLPTCKSH